jgi:23S rRNA (uracil1939-C5)-methyltransferase
MQKNDIIDATISGLTPLGHGFITRHNRTVYIPHTLPGEHVRIKILKVFSRYAYAKCIQIKTPNPSRQPSPCPISTQCGGCQLLHHQYDAHLEWKTQYITHLFPNHRVNPITKSPRPYGFRNKAQFAFQQQPDGTPAIGLYAKGSHRVIDTNHCQIQDDKINEVLHVTRAFFKSTPVSCYSHDDPTGILRHLVVRASHAHETMVILVVTATTLPFIDDYCNALKSLPHVTSIYLNLNQLHTDRIFGPSFTPIFGKKNIPMQLGRTQFTLSPSSFFQLNTRLTELMYADIKAIINARSPHHILDLYCGSGTIGLFCVQGASPYALTGIELNPDAIVDARHNAKQNNIKNTQFIHGKVEDIYPTLTSTPDCVIIDPPRSGCDTAVFDTLLKFKPKTIIYVSCNPKRLVSDLKYLSAHYTFSTLQPYDMFPFSPHIEIVVVCTLAASQT